MKKIHKRGVTPIEIIIIFLLIVLAIKGSINGGQYMLNHPLSAQTLDYAQKDSCIQNAVLSNVPSATDWSDVNGWLIKAKNDCNVECNTFKGNQMDCTSYSNSYPYTLPGDAAKTFNVLCKCKYLES